MVGYGSGLGGQVPSMGCAHQAREMARPGMSS